MTVHVIATGGTISSHWDGSAWHNLDGHTLVAELEQAQPGLTRDVEVTDVAAGPSSNLSLADMYGIAGRVADALDAGATGVVVVHGTDTIELTAFATQMVLGTTATRRPVVFTGSMRVHSHPAPDGPRNLVDAITVASSEAAIGREVLVCMDGRLHAADRVRKRDASSMDAFDSGPLPAVGSVAGGVVAFAVRAQSRDALGRVDPRRLPLVPLVLCAPGLDADAVTASLGDAPAVVVEGFGDLNLPHQVWGPVHAAAGRGATVVVTSGAFTPTSSNETLEALGVLGGGGLTSQKARVLLAAAGAVGLDAMRTRALLESYALERDAGEKGTS